MTDFVQTMKDWRRMCKTYSTDDDDCCKGCPVVDFRENGCGAIFEMEDGTDWQKYADAIAAWAKDDPAPIYPTWSEWLVQMGVFPQMMSTNPIKAIEAISNGVCKPIPADIAQKLGLQPKEGSRGT